nr:hypothetical protein [uncultured Flavobacterium sp.]
MKKIVYVVSMLVLALVVSCTNENNLIDVSSVSAPKDISALTTVTQDNTGLVTFTPRGEGVTRYEIIFGDGTKDAVFVNPGGTVNHKYKEGVYDAKITGMTIDGKRTEVIQKVVVAFRAPENLVVTIENDLQVSKKVTVTAKADFALFYDVFFGELGNANPVSANIGESVSYIYNNPGTYKIRVVAKSAAIKTTESITNFEVTAVNKPFTAAPTPPNRQAADVISLYGNKYTNVAGTNFFPDWGQGGQGSSWAEFDLNGDKMLNYIKLSYQGNALADGKTIDVSGMEFFHMDVWTADLDKIETSLISLTGGEKPVVRSLTANEWTSIDIPIKAFTDQGLKVSDIFQLKYVGIPWAKGSVFIDNIYFYKTPAQVLQLPVDMESSLTYNWIGFGSASFGAIPTAVITNPDKSGANTSNKALSIEKTAGAQVWAGASLELDTNLDFSKGKKVQVTVWSPKVGATILFKIEKKGDPNTNAEVKVNTTVANKWEVLTFDLTTAGSFNAANSYGIIVLFPDFGVDGTGTKYYFDDIKQIN